MKITWAFLGSVMLATGASSAVSAASLEVTPVNIEVLAPGAATVLTLRDSGESPVNAQLRLFRWTQVNGQEAMVPTEEVVASPPAALLKPGANYTVRIVRVNRAPVLREESYRLLVDELPDGSHLTGTAIKIVLRHSIPVFFEPRTVKGPEVTWSIMRHDGRTFVTATNNGDRRIRVSRLRLQNAKGAVASFGDGLTGYVLGHSTMQWKVPGRAQRLSGPGPVMVSSDGDLGPIRAKAKLEDIN